MYGKPPQMKDWTAYVVVMSIAFARIPELMDTAAKTQPQALWNIITRMQSCVLARTLLGSPGLTTRNKKLLGAPGIATRSKDATRVCSHAACEDLVLANIAFLNTHFVDTDPMF